VGYSIAHDCEGRYYWNKRTVEGLKEAINHFKQSIGIDPSDAEAYSGLADTYALAGDWEYGILPPAEAFPLAKAFRRCPRTTANPSYCAT